MLHIRCPKCKSMLTLDPGFRGMPCRCSVCSATLSVPKDPGSSEAKLLSPPPSAAGGSRAGSSRTGKSMSGSHRAESPLSDVWNGGVPRPTPVLAAAQQVDPTHGLVTLGGGSPGQQRQTLLIAAAVVGPTVIALICLLVLLLRPVAAPTVVSAQVPASPVAIAAPAPPPAPATIATPAATIAQPVSLPPVRVAPPAPPHVLRAVTPNVLGAPLTGPTVVYVDSVEQSAAWLSDVNAALCAGLERGGPGRIGFVYLDQGRARTVNMGAPGSVLGSLRSLQNRTPAAGRTGFWNGFDAALAMRPERVVLITARGRWADSVALLAQRLGGTGVALDVVSFAGPNPDLASVAAAHRGTFTHRTPAEIAGWLATLP